MPARRGPEVGPDERSMPPAMLERVRAAALRCLTATAADVGARPVMLTLAWDVADALAPLLGNAHTATMREGAAKVWPEPNYTASKLRPRSRSTRTPVGRCRQTCQQQQLAGC